MAGLSKRTTYRKCLIVGALTIATLVPAGCANTAQIDEERPLALVYDGPQGCDECAPAIAAVLEESPQRFRVEYVGPGTGTELTAEVLDGADLYVQPGGGSDLESTWRDLAPIAGDLRAWVENGGSYLGLCFGGYLAGRDPGFGLLPGDTFGWAGSEGASVPDDRDAVIPVTWLGSPRHMYYQDGPGFTLDDSADATVLATYSNDVPAVLVAEYGAGRVGVAGPHPEADLSWYEQEGLENPDGYSPDMIYELVAATVSKEPL